MRIITATGALLVFLVLGCTQPNSDTYRKSSSAADMQKSPDPANYHASRFGEPNNEAFQGVYSGQ